VFEDEEIEGRVKTSQALLKLAIKTVRASDDSWKERSLRLLNLLADPSVNDEVLNINDYLFLNKGLAIPVRDPSQQTWHARRELVRLLENASTDAAVISAVRDIVNAIHQGFYWAAQVQMRYSMGGGSSASQVERAAYDWISGKQTDPKSVYFAWKD
jgi:hypothetical protein